MLSLKQVEQIKKHSKEAVDSLPLELYASQPVIEADVEKVATESVTQPKIDFCHACGTALLKGV